MENKNLIYTCFDENFFKYFKYLYYSFHKYEHNCDFLCITTKNINLNAYKVIQYKTENLDTKYTGKYIISELEILDQYENILYLDSDIILLDSLNWVFEKIELDKDKIHAAKENESLNRANEYFNFDGRQFEKDTPSFNAGSFGFNKKKKEEIKKLLFYIQENKNKGIHDQPFFNIYFHDKIKNSFGEHIEFFECYKPFNSKLIHFFGTNKQRMYKRFFRKETRGEILDLIPSVSKVGLFNCGEYFENEQIKYMREKRNKTIEVKKNEYDVDNEYYDFVYIETATSINNLIEIISKIYKKVKKGGIVSSTSGNENCKKVLKEFITKSNLDYYQCFEDDVFFTIRL